MGIKNFTVTTQRVKEKADGLIGYANYLNNEKAPSHKNTKILNIGNNFDDFLKNTIINTMNFDNENKKGGRKVESYAQSFNFILPPDVPKPSFDQWKLIYKDVLLKSKEILKIEDANKVYARNCYANIHDQANPHLNFLIPRIYNKERLHTLDQKNLLSELKKEFNRSVMQHCNIDFKAYKPDQQNVGKRRKKWQLDQDQARKAKDLLVEERLELAEERLELATETLAAAQLIDRSEQVQERAETAQIKAQEATAQARQAEAAADRKISLMDEMKNIFNNFKSSINDWIKGIKSKDEILEGIALNDVVTSVKTAQKHESYDDALETLMFNTIEMAEEETKKPVISKQVSRTRKYKPY